MPSPPRPKKGVDKTTLVIYCIIGAVILIGCILLGGAMDAFDSLSEEIIDDHVMYPEPEQITLQMTHKDVVLNYFMPRKKLVFALHSGTTLTLQGKELYAQIGGKTYSVAMLSKAAQGTLNGLLAKGYRVQSARVRFMVAWRNQDESDKNEYAIILPDIFLDKPSNHQLEKSSI